VGFPAFIIFFMVIVLSILVCKVEVKGIFGGIAFIATDADLVVVSIEEEANFFIVAHPVDVVLEHRIGEDA
jgi:hypothetical protein